jgi:hypothetical protein
MDNLELAAADMVEEIQKWRTDGEPDLERIRLIQERMAMLLGIKLPD